MAQALRLNALEEVPYALGLIRQSLERQLVRGS
jgi:predicted transport protein